AVSLFCAWRISLAPVIPLVLWMFVPPSMNEAFLGGASFHVATYLILFTGLLILLTRFQLVSEELRSAVWFYLVLVFMLSGFFIMTSLSHADTSVVVLVNQVIAPAMLFFIVRLTLRADPGKLNFLVYAFIVLAVLQAGISILQFVNKDFGFYGQFYE